MDNKKTTFFGLTSFRNQKKKFGIKQDDRRRHFYTIGKTGMGKSNLMENMAIQDIQNGNGIAYVDPHGEGAEKLLDFVPADRIKDVVFLNPADLDFPIAFNVMEKVDFRYRHLVAGGLMAVFKKVWPDVWSARMEYILNNTILALLEYPDSTLLGVNRMLADPEYRKEVVSNVSDPTVKAFWVTEYARYSQKYETEATAAIQNKVGQFMSNALIRNIVGQTKSTINMRQIMDDGKILILDLSKGRIGEDNSRLLGALLITKIQLAAMSRVDIPEPDRNDFYLYVDEFQNFATESFASILSEARKYRLNLIVGHQYITQMDEIVRDAVFGNVGTLAVFRVGAEDAEFLEREFSPEFTAEDLVNLSKYNIYLKLMIDGVASHPFSAGTLAPPTPLAESNREKIINASRETYGVPREIVEDKIREWTEGAQTSMAPPAASAQGSGVPKAVGGDGKKPLVAFASPIVTNSMGSDQTVLYDAICSTCGKPTKTIFEPKAGRPVYCKSCLKKLKASKAEEAKPVAKVEVKLPTPNPVAVPRPAAQAPVQAQAPKPVESAPKPALVIKPLIQVQVPPQAPKPAESAPAPAPAAKPPVQPAPRPQFTKFVDNKSKVAAPVILPPEKSIETESAKIENISFSSVRKNNASDSRRSVAPQNSSAAAKPKRKEINLSELRKALENSLAKKEEPDEDDEPETLTAQASSFDKSSAGQVGEPKEIETPKPEVKAPPISEDSAQKGVISPGEKVNL